MKSSIYWHIQSRDGQSELMVDQNGSKVENVGFVLQEISAFELPDDVRTTVKAEARKDCISGFIQSGTRDAYGRLAKAYFVSEKDHWYGNDIDAVIDQGLDSLSDYVFPQERKSKLGRLIRQAMDGRPLKRSRLALALRMAVALAVIVAIVTFLLYWLISYCK